MAIAARFDVHRAQITFDELDTETGEVMRGRIDATPAAVARWAGRFARQQIDVAVEACTGWLFVCDALTAAGAVPHLAEPVETRALRGPRASGQDRSRGRPLAAGAAGRRSVAGRVDPAPARAAVALACEVASHACRRAPQWLQRIQATLFHHGVSGTPEKLRTREVARFSIAWTCPRTHVSGSRSHWR